MHVPLLLETLSSQLTSRILIVKGEADVATACMPLVFVVRSVGTWIHTVWVSAGDAAVVAVSLIEVGSF